MNELETDFSVMDKILIYLTILPMIIIIWSVMILLLEMVIN